MMIAHHKLTNSLYQILIENLIQVLYCVSAVQLSIVPKRPTRIPPKGTHRKLIRRQDLFFKVTVVSDKKSAFLSGSKNNRKISVIFSA